MDGPQFLVIGGMKCGSTTLYDDLRTQLEVFLAEKELNVLSAADYSLASAQATYSNAFRAAKTNQLRGDVSTTYSKLPDIPHVAERATELVGTDLKIVYVVREPVARCISHHYHMHAWRGEGHMPSDIDFCVREFPNVVNYSRYAMQLEPWRARFGDDAIHIVVFEEFVADRRAAMQQLATFLGFKAQLAAMDPTSISNRSEGKPVLNRFWSHLSRNQTYRATLRRLLPSSVRDEMRKLLLPKAPPRPAPPSLETVDYILEQTKPEERKLRKMLGRDEPIWDAAATRTRFATRPATAA